MVFLDCSNASADAPGAECVRSCHTLDVDCFSTHCVSGCVCPVGLLSDGSGGCVAEEDCPCMHNEAAYKPGEVIKVDCNTCTCRGRRWECSDRPCLGTCVAYGDGHFLTFDGERYGFEGSCEYTLAQDYCVGSDTANGTFRIVTENVPCGTTGVTCSKAIKIFLGSYELILHEGTHRVLQRGPGGDLPYRVRYMGVYLTVETHGGVVVSWDRKTSVIIRLRHEYKGRVCGLCGNFDDNALNDFTTRSQSVASDVLEFGNSWKFSPSCPDALAPRDPCTANPYRRSWAQKQCSIINSATFSACRSQVDPTRYYEACVSDACACDSGGDCECFCTAVAAYAQACHEAGVCVSWRTPDVCPLFCDYYNPHGECEWHYQPCGAPCLKTCRNPSGLCLMDLPGLEGCYPKCPSSKPFFNEDQMECVAQCSGCYDRDGNYYDAGTRVPSTENCQSCDCTSSGLQCTHSPEACTCTYEGRTYAYGDVIYNTTDGLGACLIAICRDNGTIVRRAVECPGTLFKTPFTFTSTAAPPSTTGLVPTPSTVCVRKVCHWSDWYDGGHPEPGMSGGDFETFENLRQRGYQVCLAPVDIECQAQLLPGIPLEKLGQKVECSRDKGLTCFNSEQSPPLCLNYKLRVLCCDYVPCGTSQPPSSQTTPTTGTTHPTMAVTTSQSPSTKLTTNTTPEGSSSVFPATTTCEPHCHWTEWFDMDYPKYEEGGGDFETYEKIRGAGGAVCKQPQEIECEAENYPGLTPEQVGQQVHCDVRFGLVCRNDEQLGLFKMCYNYRMRVLCCEYNHCTLPTATTSPTATATASTATAGTATTAAVPTTTTATVPTATTSTATITVPAATTSTATATVPTATTATVPTATTATVPTATTATVPTATTATVPTATTATVPTATTTVTVPTATTVTVPTATSTTATISTAATSNATAPTAAVVTATVPTAAISTGTVPTASAASSTTSTAVPTPTQTRTQTGSTVVTGSPASSATPVPALSTRLTTRVTASSPGQTGTHPTSPPGSTGSTSPGTATSVLPTQKTSQGPTSVSATTQTSTAWPPTETALSTTRTPSTQHPETSTPAPTTATTGATTSQGTTSCQPKCKWTEWFDVDYPKYEEGGGDLETYEKIRGAGGAVCKQPQEIECEAENYPGLTPEQVGQQVHCDVRFGLVCRNDEQLGLFKMCYNYRMRVLCCEYNHCTLPTATTSPTATATASTATAGTATTAAVPTTTTATVPTATTSTATITVPAATTSTATATVPTATTATVPTATTATVPTATTATVPTATTATVPTATTATVPTATTTVTVPTATTVTVPTATSTTATISTAATSNATAPTAAVVTATVPTAAISTGTVPTASAASSTTSTAVPTPTQTRTQTGSTVVTGSPASSATPVPALSTRLTTRVTASSPGQTGTHPTSPPGSTGSTSPGTATSVLPTQKTSQGPTSVSATTQTSTAWPPTETALSTTRTPSTQHPETSTPAPTTATTGATTSQGTTSCQPKCKWTEWFDVDYPKYEEGGGDLETYEKIRGAGGAVCKQPQEIECEAENYPGLTPEQVGQQVHCDVRFGLVCRNDEQLGLFKMCYNYRMRVLCCEYNHCTLPTATTSPTATATASTATAGTATTAAVPTTTTATVPTATTSTATITVPAATTSTATATVPTATTATVPTATTATVPTATTATVPTATTATVPTATTATVPTATTTVTVPTATTVTVPTATSTTATISTAATSNATAPTAAVVTATVPTAAISTGTVPTASAASSTTSTAVPTPTQTRTQTGSTVVTGSPASSATPVPALSTRLTTRVTASSPGQTGTHPTSPPGSTGSTSPGTATSVLPTQKTSQGPTSVSATTQTSTAWPPTETALSTTRTPSTQHPETSTPAPTTATTGATTSQGMTSCQPKCKWTEWFDVDYPKYEEGGGDFETYEKIRGAGGAVCKQPQEIECEAENYPGLTPEQVGQRVHCDIRLGLVCRNDEQLGLFKMCYNYRMRVLCCEYNHCTLPTATTSPTAMATASTATAGTATVPTATTATTTTATVPTATTATVPTATPATTTSAIVPTATTATIATVPTATTTTVPTATTTTVPTATTATVPTATTATVPTATTVTTTTATVPTATTTTVPTATTATVPTATTATVPTATTATVPTATSSTATTTVPMATTSTATAGTATTAEVPMATTTTAIVPTATTATVPTATTATVPTATTTIATVPTATTATTSTATVPTATTATVPMATTASVPMATTATVPSATTSTATISTAATSNATAPTAVVVTATVPTATISTGTVPTASAASSTTSTAVPTPTQTRTQMGSTVVTGSPASSATPVPALSTRLMTLVTASSPGHTGTHPTSPPGSTGPTSPGTATSVLRTQKTSQGPTSVLATTQTSTARPPTETAVSTTRTPSTQHPEISTPAPTTATTGATTSQGTTSCQPKCKWTEWFDVDYPKYEEGGGDFETYEKIRGAGGAVCKQPQEIECEAENYPGLTPEQVGQRVHCDIRLGLVCRNDEQLGLFKMCYNYRMRVLCCEYNHCTLPTATTSPTATATASTATAGTATVPTATPATTTSATVPTATTATIATVPTATTTTVPTATTATVPTATTATVPTATTATVPTATTTTATVPTATTATVPTATTATTTTATVPTATMATVPTATATTATVPTATTATTTTATVPTATTATVPTATSSTATAATATTAEVPMATTTTAIVPTATTATVSTATTSTATVPTATTATVPTATTASVPMATTATVPSATTSTATISIAATSNATAPTAAVVTATVPTAAISTGTVPTASAASSTTSTAVPTPTQTRTQTGSTVVTGSPASSATPVPALSTRLTTQVTASSPGHTGTHPTSPPGSTGSTSPGTATSVLLTQKTSQGPTSVLATTQTSTARPPTEIALSTTYTRSTQHPETSTPAPATATTGATTSQGVTSCQPKCKWTEWFDVDFPTSGVMGGDIETYDNIRAAGGKMCQDPEKIECRAENYPEVSIDQIGQVLNCSLETGLVCRNEDQRGPFTMCFNYNIRVYCCDDVRHCPTTATPGLRSTSLPPGSSTATGPWPPTSTTTWPPFSSSKVLPMTLKPTLTGAPSTVTVVTSHILESTSVTNLPPSPVMPTTRATTHTQFLPPTTSKGMTQITELPTRPSETTTRPPVTTLSTGQATSRTGVGTRTSLSPPGPEPSTSSLGTTLGPTTTTTSMATLSSPKTHTSGTTLVPTSPGTESTTCERRCAWTDWMDKSYPMPGAYGGDYETYANIQAAGGAICEQPLKLECRAEELPDIPLPDLGQVVLCQLEVGLVCRNQDQSGQMCLNYQIRLLCCDKSYCPSTAITTSTPTSETGLSSTVTTGRVSIPTSVTGPSSTVTTERVSTPMSLPGPSSMVTSGVVSTTTSVTGPSSKATTKRVSTRTSVTGPSSMVTTKRTSTPTSVTGPSSKATTERVSTPTSVTGPSSTAITERTSTPTSVTGPSSKATMEKVSTPSMTGPSSTVITKRVSTPTSVTGPSSTVTTEGVSTPTSVTGPSSTAITERTSTPTSVTGPSSTATTEGVSTPTSVTGPSSMATTERTSTPTSVTGPSSRATTERVSISSPSAFPGSPPMTTKPDLSSYSPTGDIVYNKTDGAGCPFLAICNQRCDLDRFQGDCTTSSPPGTSASVPPTTPVSDCDRTIPPRKVNESWFLEDCTVARCEGDNRVTLLGPRPMSSITCVNGHLPVKVQNQSHRCDYHYECECVCSGWGDTHYETFDGTSYSFWDNCTYVLVREIQPRHGNLRILLHNRFCEATAHCPRALSIHYQSMDIVLSTTSSAAGQDESLILLDQTRVRQSFSKNGVIVTLTGATGMRVDIPAVGVGITFNGRVFQARLSYSRFSHNTEGQCGTCTNNRRDECRRPDGTTARTCRDMARSWLVSNSSLEGCGVPTGLPPTTSPLLPETSTPAIHPSCPPEPLCELMLSSVFAGCHSLIPPGPYFNACVSDSCWPGRGRKVLCQSLEAYAELCRSRGVCPDWRNATHGLCDLTCPSAKVYKSCGPVQPESCDSRSQSPLSVGLAEGCFCPDGHILFNSHRDICVPECPCVGPDGLPKFPGERWVSNCQDCVCDNGTVSVQCTPVECLAPDQPQQCGRAGFVAVSRPLADNPCCMENLCVCNASTCPQSPPACRLGEKLVHTQVEDDCCPTFSCQPLLCTFNGTFYGVGATIPGVTPCHTCTCLSMDSEDPTVRCEEEACNTTCLQGFEYSTVAGQCCGECVQTACLAPDGQLVQLNETWVNSLVDNCTEYHCQARDGPPMLTPMPVVCPDVSTCKGILKKIGCCYYCVQTDACQVHTNMTVLRHRGCVTQAAVKVSFCEGSCPKVSRYSMEAQARQCSCSCCQETRTHQEVVTMQCPDGTAFQHTYTHVDECSCVPACASSPQTLEDSSSTFPVLGFTTV
ncbi:hypothetical protein E5288_WYG016165 [Bos mutus]|uniref:Mucin-5B n=1 Tax=Bos mutus TaxID=72004 RepID=A0A6B0RQZ2_9CETA|nr:hypothetical protein [Bos mutus]